MWPVTINKRVNRLFSVGLNRFSVLRTDRNCVDKFLSLDVVTIYLLYLYLVAEMSRSWKNCFVNIFHGYSIYIFKYISPLLWLCDWCCKLNLDRFLKLSGLCWEEVMQVCKYLTRYMSKGSVNNLECSKPNQNDMFNLQISNNGLPWCRDFGISELKLHTCTNSNLFKYMPIPRWHTKLDSSLGHELSSSSLKFQLVTKTNRLNTFYLLCVWNKKIQKHLPGACLWFIL